MAVLNRKETVTHRRILTILDSIDARGITDENLVVQFQARFGRTVSESSIRTRRHELVGMDKVKWSGQMGKTATGSAAKKWTRA